MRGARSDRRRHEFGGRKLSTDRKKGEIQGEVLRVDCSRSQGKEGDFVEQEQRFLRCVFLRQEEDERKVVRLGQRES